MIHRHRRLIWRLYITYLVVVVLTTAAVGINATSYVMPHLLQNTQRELHDKCGMITPTLASAVLQQAPADPAGQGAEAPQEPFASNNAAAGPPINSDLQDLVVQLAEAGSTRITTRITIMGPSGDVMADSLESPGAMENHGNRPEFISVMDGASFGTDRRISPTLGTDMMYVAVPLQADDGQVAAVVRCAMPVSEIKVAANSVYRRIVTGAVVVAALAAALGFLLSLGISRPIAQIADGARRYAAGDLSQRISAEGYAEAESLADSLNAMAVQLDQRIRTLLRQQKEQQAVLGGMAEGVLAIDLRQRVLIINQAASAMLSVTAAEPQGRSLAEVVRHHGFQQFVDTAMLSARPVESDIDFADIVPRHLHVNASPLRDDQDRHIGMVIVLSDITRLRRLENVRRDFVANVSHELKTPITSIQGFVETLRDGAAADPDSSARFLEIIAHQADRLSAIVDDLLSLSRIEQDAENARVEMARAAVGNILSAAAGACQDAASQRQVALQIESPMNIFVRANAQLIEQAIVNLLQNAIRYSREGDNIILRATIENGDWLAISVTDHGCGIAREHLPRIFERFYCVDKARSRKLGGTGLGLAIVKHIVQAHGGRVTVQSVVEQGSTFTLHLPGVCS